MIALKYKECMTDMKGRVRGIVSLSNMAEKPFFLCLYIIFHAMFTKMVFDIQLPFTTASVIPSYAIEFMKLALVFRFLQFSDNFVLNL